jgi:hypothetical protein
VTEPRPTPVLVGSAQLMRAMAHPRGRLGVQRLATSLGVALIGLSRQDIAAGLAAMCARDLQIGTAQRKLARELAARSA